MRAERNGSRINPASPVFDGSRAPVSVASRKYHWARRTPRAAGDGYAATSVHGEEERMQTSRPKRAAFMVLALAGAGMTLGACTYVERERPAQPQSTVVVPPTQQPATVVTPQPAPTVTVRPSY
jgi:hypothetical protein